MKNAIVAIGFYTLNTILGFWSRQIFYDYLGSEVLGLDTTVSTLLGFLNLAELGVSSAVGYFLYSPMFEGATNKINEIVALQGWIYRRVAYVILFLSIVLMFFFPVIFDGMDLPLWYAYITFSVMLFGSLLGYFINYRQCVLYADQKGYKVTKVTSTAGVLLRVLLIVLLPTVQYPFFLYVGTNLLASIIGCFWLNHTLKKEYPWLAQVEKNGKQLLKEYPEILVKTKQLFFHKITTVIVNQLAPLIMYAFTTLTIVAYYGNYLAVIDRAKDVLKNAFGSTSAGIGNLIASRDDKRINSVFWELLDSRMAISFASILVLYFITEPFISVWLSPDYLLDKSVLIIISLLSFLSINRSTVDSFIGGYGLFHDVPATVIEAIINLGSSILLGWLYGVTGVLCGNLISTLVIIYGWKPYFLYKQGFKKSFLHNYLTPVILRWFLLLSNAFIFIYLNSKCAPDFFTNYLDLILYALVLSVVIIPIIYIEFSLLTQGMRDFNSRMFRMFIHRFKNIPKDENF